MKHSTHNLDVSLTSLDSLGSLQRFRISYLPRALVLGYKGLIRNQDRSMSSHGWWRSVSASRCFVNDVGDTNH